MNISFQTDDSLDPTDLEVVVRAAQFTPEVAALLAKLNQLGQRSQTLPVNLDEQTVLIPEADIVAVEVFRNNITIHTLNRDYTTRGTLKKLLTRLDATTFRQINRSIVINLNHLELLEVAFSGNLLAKMQTGLKLTVSRGYVADLKRYLGM